MFGVLAVMVGLVSTARADRLAASRLDVTYPPGWSLYYPEHPVDTLDQVLHVDGEMHGPLLMISHYLPQDSPCTAAMASVLRDNEVSEAPDWVPGAYTNAAIAFPPNAQGVAAVAVCVERADGSALLVIVAPTHGSSFADATPMLEALVVATDVTDEPAPEYQPAPDETVIAVAEDPATGYESTTTDDPAAVDEPPPASRDDRPRPMHLGIGAEYLKPADGLETGYGLAVSLGYDRHLPLGGSHLELRGLYGVDSSAGFWLDMHAHLAIPVVPGDTFTFSILAGAGVDGVGKAGDPMKLHVPYAGSGQLGVRLDVSEYEAEATLAVRAKGEGEPGSAVRATLRRRWFARRLSSVGVSYFKYGATAGRAELLIDFAF
jgi:hypothetical protein